MEKTGKDEPKAHFLILPYPSQGHINPMIQFSKRLANKGINITIAAVEDLIKSRQEFSSWISVETISDGFDAQTRKQATSKEHTVMFQDLGTQSLSKLLEKFKTTGRPVDCIIYDSFLPWGLVVAKKYGLVGASFFTQSSAVNNIYYHVYNGKLKLPLLEGSEVILPGLPPFKTSDLPSFLCDSESFPGSLELLLNQFQNVEEADWVLVNTIYELEEEATDWMAKILAVKTIGPTIPSIYLDKRMLDDKEYGLSIFKPVKDCMEWLRHCTSKSVIYVSFGSVASLEIEQMEELALALKATNKYFLWVVRSSEESKLPTNFVQETQEKGLVVSWCPQLEVLEHDAIGCFLTHCGWNSTLEALSLGVPMVAMPWWSDQGTNAKLVMDVWKMGTRVRPDVKNVVRREEIVRCLNYVMEGEDAEEIRKDARKWKELTRKAIDEGGSSDRNIREFVSSFVV